jgi:hypothetical protein
MKSAPKSTLSCPRPIIRITRRLTVNCRFIVVVAALFTLQLFAATMVSADGLTADLLPLGMDTRNGAPIPVDARLDWDGSGILEGRLEMEFYEGNRVLGHYRSDEMALSGGEQKFHMLLPPILAPVSDSQVEVHMKFVTAAKVIELDPSQLFVPTTSQRSLVVGWFDSGAGAEQPFDVVRNLLFERYAPPSDDPSQKLVTTGITRETSEDLPAEPLAYVSFDVVVLTAEAFAETHERQLEALARWVRGGGSVCVFAAGTLQPYHIEFLNQLAEATSAGPVFLSDSSGKLLPPQKDVLCLHSGVGRSVIVTGDKATTVNLDADEWRNVATFLWKLRNNQIRAIADTGHWQPPVAPGENQPAFKFSQNGYNPYNQNYQYAQPFSLFVQPTGLGSELLTRLMPKTVRLIPFSALIGILVLFLIMVGPADYYGLGFFRRRRLTWVLFPVTSIVFTGATVLMANHYLGLRDQRCSLTVVDLDKDGSALRWNCYELVFAARDKQSATDLKDTLWAQLDARTTLDYYPVPYRNRVSYRSYGGRYAGYPGDNDDPPWYEGTLPIRYQTRENIHQWQPELNRMFSFEPPPVPLPANWNAIEEAWPNLPAIRSILSKAKPFNGDLCAIFNSNTMTTSFVNGILEPSILNEICVGNPTGLQYLVSQISPTGGSYFEDLPAMGTDANDSVLLIITKSGDDIIVYRRFFYGN